MIYRNSMRIAGLMVAGTLLTASLDRWFTRPSRRIPSPQLRHRQLPQPRVPLQPRPA